MAHKSGWRPRRKLRSLEDLRMPSVTPVKERLVKGGPCPGTNTSPLRPGRA